MFNKRVYFTANILILLLAAVLFISSCLNSSEIIFNIDWQMVAVLIVTAIISHFLKALRLYLEFYEFNISKAVFTKQYCKVIPVSILLPFKSGDIFRAYSYGYAIGNYYAGFSVVLLDRFVDTVALIFVMLIFSFSMGIHLTFVFYLLLTFLGLLALIYFRFPYMYRYWKKYLIKSKSSQRTIKHLRSIENLKRAFDHVETVVRGKFLITFLISVCAWLVEIGGLVIYCQWTNQYDHLVVSDYLTGILSGNQHEYLTQFIILSVSIFAILYAAVSITLIIRRRKEKK